MKRIIAAAITMLSMAGLAGATSIAYNKTTTTVVASTVTGASVDMSVSPIDLLSAQVNMTQVNGGATIKFTDGTQSTGTITVGTVGALSVQQGSATISVTNNAQLVPAQGTLTVTISSNGAAGILTGSTLTINGVPIYAGTSYTIGASSNATAVSLLAAIAAVPNISGVISPPGGGAIVLTCTTPGSFCNSYNAITSTVAIAFSTAGLSNGFTGGQDNAAIVINGVAYPQGSTWMQGAVSSNTASSISNFFNNYSIFVATTPSSTSTDALIQCAKGGSFCNAITVSVTGKGLSAVTPTFVTGQDNAFININNRILTQGSQWTVVGSSVQVSTAIAAAINADATLSKLVTASAPTTCPSCGIVTVTGLISLTGNNYTWYSSTPSQLAMTNSGLFGGTTAGFLLGGNTILAPAHGLSTGQEVYYTTGTVAIGGLTNATTYYVTAIDANDIALSTSAYDVTISSYIVFTSSSTAGPHTYTLLSGALTGSIVATWQGSNDNVNWGNLNVSAMTFSSPYAATSTVWDFGAVNFKYARLLVAGPPTGAATVQTIIVGKRYGLGL